MRFYNMTVSELKGIAMSGGGMVLNASNYTVSELKGIAIIYKDKDAYLILKNLNRFTVSELKGIAQAGGEKVIFDFYG